MRYLVISGLFLILGCSDHPVEKPKKLINEDKMVDILYDMAVLEAARSNHPLVLAHHNVDAHTYVYDKYDIDSLQFAQNNKYYAQDIENYSKMYKKIVQRLNEQKVKVDTILKKAANAPQPKLEIDAEKKEQYEADKVPPSLGGAPVSN